MTFRRFRLALQAATNGSRSTWAKTVWPTGHAVEISFTGDPDSCKWDLKVDWAEDYPATVWQDVNLCNISNITLHYNRDTDETTAELK